MVPWSNQAHGKVDSNIVQEVLGGWGSNLVLPRQLLVALGNSINKLYVYQ